MLMSFVSRPDVAAQISKSLNVKNNFQKKKKEKENGKMEEEVDEKRKSF